MVEQTAHGYDETLETIQSITDDGAGRIGAETPDKQTGYLHTEYGRLCTIPPVDNAWREGADFTKEWVYGHYTLTVSHDRTPESRPLTVFVRE